MIDVDRFGAVVTDAAEQLWACPPQALSDRPNPGAWSKKEELGHLIDSAINNYARVIRIQREDAPALPAYEQDAWVERQGYNDNDWQGLITLWLGLNQHMLNAVRRVPESALTRTSTIANHQPMTLEFVIEDYVDHMIHHLQHIGVELSRFRRAESAYA